jgi:hypothetical protein
VPATSKRQPSSEHAQDQNDDDDQDDQANNANSHEHSVPGSAGAQTTGYAEAGGLGRRRPPGTMMIGL